MFNLPPNIFNSPYLQGLAGNSKGPKWSETNPFRTVSGIGHYGSGLNSSASQIYEHFSGAQNAQGRKYRDHGLKPINPKTQIQSWEEFSNRRNPAPVQPPQPVVPPPQAPTSGGFGGAMPNFNPAQGIFNIPQFSQAQAAPQQMSSMQSWLPSQPQAAPQLGMPQQPMSQLPPRSLSIFNRR